MIATFAPTPAEPAALTNPPAPAPMTTMLYLQVQMDQSPSKMGNVSEHAFADKREQRNPVCKFQTSAKDVVSKRVFGRPQTAQRARAGLRWRYLLFVSRSWRFPIYRVDIVQQVDVMLIQREHCRMVACFCRQLLPSPGLQVHLSHVFASKSR